MADPAERSAGLAAAVAVLRAGELVAIPTETVYGLAADAGQAKAVAAIYRAKQRPDFNPLIAHVASLQAAAQLAHIDDAGARLARAFWPGPLTLVLPRRADSGLCPQATAGLDTIAIRVPRTPVSRALLAAFGGPLVAPSANRSGHVSATTAAHVVADLGEAVAVILDDGRSEVGIESTIVEMSGDRPALLRKGALARRDIEAVLAGPLAEPQAGTRVLAPGMMASHYAPRATVRLNARSVEEGEALLQFGGQMVADAGRAVATIDLSVRGDLDEAAAELFAALRDLDRCAARIAVVPIPQEGAGEAINDRLRRAAAPKDHALDSSSRTS